MSRKASACVFRTTLITLADALMCELGRQKDKKVDRKTRHRFGAPFGHLLETFWFRLGHLLAPFGPRWFFLAQKSCPILAGLMSDYGFGPRPPQWLPTASTPKRTRPLWLPFGNHFGHRGWPEATRGTARLRPRVAVSYKF